MGQQLAKLNMPTVIAMLVREFHLTLAPQVLRISLSHATVAFRLTGCLQSVIERKSPTVCKISPAHISFGIVLSRFVCMHVDSIFHEPQQKGFRLLLHKSAALLQVSVLNCMSMGAHGCECSLQMVGKGIEELEALRATLQPKDGIYMLCKPRA